MNIIICWKKKSAKTVDEALSQYTQYCGILSLWKAKNKYFYFPIIPNRIISSDFYFIFHMAPEFVVGEHFFLLLPC